MFISPPVHNCEPQSPSIMKICRLALLLLPFKAAKADFHSYQTSPQIAAPDFELTFDNGSENTKCYCNADFSLSQHLVAHAFAFTDQCAEDFGVTLSGVYCNGHCDSCGGARGPPANTNYDYRTKYPGFGVGASLLNGYNVGTAEAQTVVFDFGCDVTDVEVALLDSNTDRTLEAFYEDMKVDTRTRQIGATSNNGFFGWTNMATPITKVKLIPPTNSAWIAVDTLRWICGVPDGECPTGWSMIRTSKIPDGENFNDKNDDNYACKEGPLQG